MGFHHLDAMKYDLKLTEKQVEKIYDIGKKFRDKFFKNRGNPDRMQSLRTEHRKAIENVLTKKQKEKFKNYFSRSGKYGWFGGCYGRAL